MNIVVQVDGVTIDSVIGERYSLDDERRVASSTMASPSVWGTRANLSRGPSGERCMSGIRSVRNEVIRELVTAAEIDGALKKELAAVLADEKAKVVAAVRAKAAELIATAVKEGIGR